MVNTYLKNYIKKMYSNEVNKADYEKMRINVLNLFSYDEFRNTQQIVFEEFNKNEGVV